MHNLSFQPDSAIPQGGIAARPWHRPGANLRAVLVGLRRSFAGGPAEKRDAGERPS